MSKTLHPQKWKVWRDFGRESMTDQVHRHEGRWENYRWLDSQFQPGEQDPGNLPGSQPCRLVSFFPGMCGSHLSSAIPDLMPSPNWEVYL